MVRFPATAPVMVEFFVPDFISFRDRVEYFLLLKCKTLMLNSHIFFELQRSYYYYYYYYFCIGAGDSGSSSGGVALLGCAVLCCHSQGTDGAAWSLADSSALLPDPSFAA